MSNIENTSDPLIEQIFSKVELTPVNFESNPKHVSINDEHNYSEDEAIRQLDIILKEQNSSTNSLLDSEPSEAELPNFNNDDDQSSTTLKSPRSSRANTDIEGGYDFENYRNYESTYVNDEWRSDEQPRLESSIIIPPMDKKNEYRIRSQTYDSIASAAESRYGGFDLCNDNDDNEINLNHNEVAYHTSLNIASSNNHSNSNKINDINLHQIKKEEAIDKNKLLEYQQQLIEAKEKEKKLNQEIHKYQSQLLSKEFKVRQATENIKKQLIQIEEEKKINKMSEQKFKKDNIKNLQNKNFNDNNYSSEKQKNIPKFQPEHEKQHSNYSSSQYSHKLEPTHVDIYEEEVPVSDILHNQLKNAQLVETIPEFRYYQPQYKHIKLTNNIEKFIIGGEQQSTNDDKSVLLFGPIASGKTALINTMMNYLYDVKKEHDIRLCINYSLNTESTKGINVYVFNNTIYPYSITIIDTPGIPNRKGYSTTSSLVKNWFELELKIIKKLRIDAISVVLRHDEGELGWPLINELAAIKRLLKDDLRTNVMPVTTFGDVLPQPQALRSIVFANIPFISYYKINNVGYMQVPPGQKPLQHILSYKHSAAELERYFTDLHELVVPLLAVSHHNN